MTTHLLANYLKMYRRRSGLLQHELAVLLGCESGSKVSRYERGQRDPTLPTIVAYEVVFRAPLHRLFSGLHREVSHDVERRARRLDRLIRGKPRRTPADERKLNLLSHIINDLPTSIL